jgi:predicted transcriptional regulator
MKSKQKDPGNIHEQKLDKVIELLQHLIVLELSRRGATQEAIGKNLRVAKSSVVKMLSGTKREIANN